MTERHVDEVDAERVLVFGCELDGGDDIARRSAAAVVEDAKADQVRVRRHTFELAIGQLSASGDETGDMCAVPVAVKGRRGHAGLTVGEVIERADAPREVRDGCDAGVDD